MFDLLGSKVVVMALACLFFMGQPQEKTPKGPPAEKQTKSKGTGTPTTTTKTSSKGLTSDQLWQYMLWLMALAGILVVVAVVLVFLRASFRKRTDEDEDGLSLEKYREMYEEGELSTDEFKKIKLLVHEKQGPSPLPKRKDSQEPATVPEGSKLEPPTLTDGSAGSEGNDGDPGESNPPDSSATTS